MDLKQPSSYPGNR